MVDDHALVSHHQINWAIWVFAHDRKHSRRHEWLIVLLLGEQGELQHAQWTISNNVPEWRSPLIMDSIEHNIHVCCFVPYMQVELLIRKCGAVVRCGQKQTSTVDLYIAIPERTYYAQRPLCLCCISDRIREHDRCGHQFETSACGCWTSSTKFGKTDFWRFHLHVWMGRFSLLWNMAVSTRIELRERWPWCNTSSECG